MSAISIIIITYNRAVDALQLLQCIETLQQKEELLKEVIVLNNNSDANYDMVSAYITEHPSIKGNYQMAPHNMGVSKGRNYAAAMASGNILFFLDDDILLKDEALLSAISKAFTRTTGMHKRLGVLNGKVRYSANGAIQVTAFPHKQFERYKNTPWFLTGYYVGCAHAFLRECWLAAGNYPEDFFYGMEEYDESYRVLNAGYAIGYDASIEVFHKESPLGRIGKAEQLRMMWVNKSVVAWRYLPWPYFVSTALAWSAFFLMRSKLNLPQFFRGCAAIAKIPFSVARPGISAATKDYLRQVQARLWF
jgi:GT2 family glycosyltransferase